MMGPSTWFPKQEKKQNMKRKSSAVPFPDVANMDDLAYLSDEELAGRANRMEADRRRAASTSSELRPWEEEIAYVRREQQLRMTRTELHRAWIRKQPAHEPEPEVDFETEVE